MGSIAKHHGVWLAALLGTLSLAMAACPDDGDGDGWPEVYLQFMGEDRLKAGGKLVRLEDDGSIRWERPYGRPLEIDALVVTDTIPLSAEAVGCQRIRQLTVASMLAETIRRIHREESVSNMYMD